MSGLESIGYLCKGEINILFSLYFPDAHNTVHLSIYEQGSPEIELNITFRNYLRTHTEARDKYAAIKAKLLKQKDARNKIETNTRFSRYTLGKDQFITRVLTTAGFSRLRLMPCTHNNEWSTYTLRLSSSWFVSLRDSVSVTYSSVRSFDFTTWLPARLFEMLWVYHRIRKEILFNYSDIEYDPKHSSMYQDNSYNFILYRGEIVSVALVELLNEQTAILPR